MFFPERITGIRESDRVLEVGPGGHPFERSDVLLDMEFYDEQVATSQRGNQPLVTNGKPLVLYDGGKFPFADKAFDYVICSHVVEHVADVEAFLSELSRVAKRGYIEFPSIYYELMYGFDPHLQFVGRDEDGRVIFFPKANVDLSYLAPFQMFLRKSLDCGYSQIVDAANQAMFIGFEWSDKVTGRRADSLLDLYESIDASIERHKELPVVPMHPLKRALRRLASIIKTCRA